VRGSSETELTVTLAVAQLAPRIGDPEGNRDRGAAAIVAAADKGAELVVLPELCNSGYVFADAHEARALAEPVTGPSVERWRELAQEHDLVVVAGLCELDDEGVVRNSAVVIDSGELRAIHRKAHLWDREKLCFEPGDVPPPVVETSVGLVGVAVCYDAFFPEVMRALSLAGADVIAVPMNAPVLAPPLEPLIADLITACASAQANRVYVAQADRTGTERCVDWVGASVIVDPDGRMLTAKAPGEALLTATVDLARARDKSFSERNDVLADRRPELYGGKAPVIARAAESPADAGRTPSAIA
jgi:predicted amidohydrolase